MSDLSYIYKAFKIVWKNSRSGLILTILIRITLGLLPLLLLWVTKELIDEVATIIKGNSSQYKFIIILLFLQFSLAVIRSGLENLSTYLKTKMEFNVNYYINKELALKSISVPLEYFEVTEFHTHYDRIKRSNLGLQILTPINSILYAFENLLSLISYLSFLYIIHWSLVIISVISFIPFLLIDSKLGSYKYSLLRAQTPSYREAFYILSLLHNRQSAKEIRIFDLGPYLIKRWGLLFRKNNAETLSLTRKEKLISIGTDSFTALLYGCAAVIVVWLLKIGKVSIGQFVSMSQAIQGAQSSVNTIAGYLAMIYEQKLYLADLFKFMEFNRGELEIAASSELDKSVNTVFPLKNNIIFKDVSFFYPDSTRKTLKNVSFNINKGELIAIVGENGSGKTTLIKCLMGLYHVKEGSITFDKVNINEIKQIDLRRNITAIFQDFMKYSFSIKDNITFGDVENKNNFELLNEVSRKANITPIVESFNDGYDTYLGKLLRDGEELSGGQWQKVAIARALFSNSEIIILDEPTAALDPQSELEIFEKFNELFSNKTTIYISHRMASVKKADRILVMKNGELIESGNFNELISNKGEFYKMYDSQAKWYNQV